MKRNKIRILPARPSSGGGYLSKEETIEFERLNKTKRKKLIIAGILGLGIIIGGIGLYRSYALYEEEKEYNVLKGQIPDFGYDVKFAVTVDGTKSTKIPSRQKSADNSYYKVKVSCENGTTVGEWDYNAWNVKLDDISDGSKCTLAFTGGMSKEDYQKYIEQGIATRRNTYRGKELTLNDSFWTSIKNGTFDDIYVGDYIKSSSGKKDMFSQDVIWLVADIDNYMNTGCKDEECGSGKTGDYILKKHHLTIIPAVPLTTAKISETYDNTNGYKGSKMCTETLGNVYTQYIQPDFGDDHIISYINLLTNQIDAEATNRTGKSDDLGASNGWEWVSDRKLDLMSEMNVYGGTVVSSSVYDTGIDNRQYAIFQLKPEFINSYETTRYSYWLKDIASSKSHSAVENTSHSGYRNTDQPHGVRPRFLIG